MSEVKFQEMPDKVLLRCDPLPRNGEGLMEYVRADLYDTLRADNAALKGLCERAVKAANDVAEQYRAIRNSSDGVAKFITDDRAVTPWSEFDSGPLDRVNALVQSIEAREGET